MGHVCTPVLLAKQIIFFSAISLENPFIKGDHLPLGREAWFSAILGPYAIFVGWIGFSNAFQCFKELPNALWYRGSTELMLVLSVLRNHSEDVVC